ncbi:hypothetical protein FFWV33_07210 [Flavobacterium faecale]|uniref:DUF445 domain-containing protein n=1 Tax=Flavobacterium faecale TaxID=1355330 RepID=A0A2S1LC90_9FLAO|nr:DUF445 domain-containing protein [Flavobacterium faecale]AWG21331.1 hypothetical protein FFWV33_07210 [Flavobacterium faecale]
MKNNLGFLSLLIAFSGLVLFELLVRTDILSNPAWKLVIAGFEAATIGGFADWFAVSALFREIPIPIVRKHTNIIAKNRAKLTEGIVDLVTNKWLSPEVISGKLSEINLVEKIIQFLKKPDNQKKSIEVIQKIVLVLADDLDSPKLASNLKTVFTKQIGQLDLGSTLGQWLEKSIKNGDHNQIWELMIQAGSKAISNEDTREKLLSKLAVAATEYKEKGLVKKITLFLAESTGGIDLDSIADSLLEQANVFIEEAKSNPEHPIRVKFDDWILDFAHKLATGDGDSKKMIDNFINGFTENADAESMIQKLLVNFKKTLIVQLENHETPLMKFVITKLNSVLSDLEQNPETQANVNRWIKDTISNLITEFHGEIGNMVRDSLAKLDNAELVHQIEDKVGNDLQYIRLNGAVVGGLVGILIAVVKLALG